MGIAPTCHAILTCNTDLHEMNVQQEIERALERKLQIRVPQATIRHDLAMGLAGGAGDVVRCCAVLQCMVWRGMVWLVMLCHVVWCGVVLCCVA